MGPTYHLNKFEQALLKKANHTNSSQKEFETVPVLEQSMETAETDQIRATPDIEAAYGDASSNGGERVNARGGADDGDAEGKATRTKLKRGVDIAQAFQRDDDQGSYFQLGRVQAMYSNTSGSYKEWRLPLDFESRQSGLTLVCR